MKTEKESKIFLKVSSNRNFYILPFKKTIPTHQQTYVSSLKLPKRKEKDMTLFQTCLKSSGNKVIKNIFQCTFFSKKI